MDYGYASPMDRGYNIAHDNSRGFPGSSGKATGDVGVAIGDLGMTLAMGPVPNVKAIQSKLHAGIKKLEFVFSGTGKGQPGQQTPGMYGKKQRQAFVEIGKANKVDFTTHSTFGVYGLAGMDQQGNVSQASKNFSISEVKRAIEFAAEVAAGGPVVVHTGEYQRNLADSDWNKEEEYKGKFKMFTDEEKTASYRVVDTRSGRLVSEASKGKRVARPVYNKYDDKSEQWKEHGGKDYFDEQSQQWVKPNDYIDYFGKKISAAERVPRFDATKQEFEIKQLEWEDLEEEAEEMTKSAKEAWRDLQAGKISKDEFKEGKWQRFANITDEKDIEVKPEEAYIITTLETSAANARGWGVYYGGDFDETIETIKKLREARKFYQELQDSLDENEKWKLERQARTALGAVGDLVPEGTELPTAVIDRHLREMEKRMRYSKEASSSQWSQAKESEETQKFVESADTFAFKQSCDSYAQLAMSAFDQTRDLEKKMKLKKPLSVAMENLFPESYGAHPDEMIKLVQSSRNKMVEYLKKRGITDENKAREIAKTHITSTFDTGHLNMWRKYWVGDPKKSIEQNDKDFDKWQLKKFGEMIDAGVVGHIHLDDNYGYQDEHLAPGEGNTPIREMVKMLKEKKYKGEMIVEPGSDYTTDLTGFHSVMKTWRHFNTPVYGSGSGLAPTKATWENVGYGWVGHNQPPYFTFGAYGPSEDWTLWSNVPLE
jgi:sugar phosphate isomerase/epimerase